MNPRDKDFGMRINNIPVAYEDERILIVDKPSGLLTIPTPKEELRTLGNLLNQQARHRCLSYRLHLCHRLDRETSGLIILAKGRSMQKKMMEEFKRRRIKKIYIAFVQGTINQNNGQIKRTIEGKYAVTRFRVLERKDRFTILEVMPLTGRKNQIRIHFKNIGHPLVGETKFAFRKDYTLRAKRICLHAKYLEFRHPVTKKIISVNSEMPEDLKDFLKKHNNN